MKIIEIEISPTGDTKLQTKGFSGSDCLAASSDLEMLLGVKHSEVHTSEFFQQADTHQSAQQQEQ